MIVGNGEISQAAGAMIDACDLVIRFNDCRSLGRGGGKTDVVAVCNTGRPARGMVTSDAWRGSAAVSQASAIWCVRDPRKFSELRAPLMASHPELYDLCDDFTPQFAAFSAATGKAHYVVDRAMHEAVDEELQPHQPGAYVVPSSGLIVIRDVLNTAGPHDTVSIAGFGHVGWSGHPFAAEKRLVDSYAAAGRITRISEPSLTSSSQGA